VPVAMVPGAVEVDGAAGVWVRVEAVAMVWARGVKAEAMEVMVGA